MEALLQNSSVLRFSAGAISIWQLYSYLRMLSLRFWGQYPQPPRGALLLDPVQQLAFTKSPSAPPVTKCWLCPNTHSKSMKPYSSQCSAYNTWSETRECHPHQNFVQVSAHECLRLSRAFHSCRH